MDALVWCAWITSSAMMAAALLAFREKAESEKRQAASLAEQLDLARLHRKTALDKATHESAFSLALTQKAKHLVSKIEHVGEAEDWSNGNETARRYEYHEFHDLMDLVKKYSAPGL